MKFIKNLLQRTLGERRYLFFVAACYQWMYKTGWLGKLYQDVYFLKNIIKPGDLAVDIGAHLGYYTFELSRLAGKKGKVIAIEPVSKFFSVIKRRAAKNPNISLFNVALGGKGETVEMGIPWVKDEKKFGYARIKEMHEYLEYAETETVSNVNGDELLKDLPRLDFLKCDVEGAEIAVFTSLMQTVQKYKPVILCELADKNDRIKMYDMFHRAGYSAYLLRGKMLHPLDVNSDEEAISHNHYFIPLARIDRLTQFVSVS